MMSKGKQSDTALILDDEPEYLDWIEDYLESLGLRVRFETAVSRALVAIQDADFRLLLVDMNVPDGGALTAERREALPLASRYPGLVLAQEARNRGYGGHSVVVYSVHDDDQADALVESLRCRYVLKGRPEVFKRVIRDSLDVG